MTARFGAPIPIRGVQGSAGPRGASVLAGLGAPPADLGQVGDTYVDLSQGVLHAPKTPEGWPGITRSLVGADGKPGTGLLNGYGPPDDSLGREGDTYFNSQNGSVVGPKSGGTWPTESASLVGPPGPLGEVGTLIYAANGPPSDVQGRDNDFFVNTEQAIFYGPKTEGSWGEGFSLIGPRGATGERGVEGQAGSAGASVLMGSGEPSSLVGKPGDVFINNTDHVIYGPKTSDNSSPWPLPGYSYGGPEGPRGEAGPAGRDGRSGSALHAGDEPPDNTLGLEGDFYFQRTSSVLIGPKGATQWPNEGTSLRGQPGEVGPSGEAGPAGPRGPGILSGSGAPGATLGETGAFYLDADNWRIFGPKDATLNWNHSKSLIGEAGPAGADSTVPGPPGDIGPRGQSLLSGYGPPSALVGEEGDSYVDLASANLYPAKAGPLWSTEPRSLAGPAGPQGPASTVPGPSGPRGYSLITGSGAPSASDGEDHDVYLDKDAARLYPAKSGGAWSPSFVSLVGPAGAPGEAGPAGQNGSILRYGVGSPSTNTTGNNGDFFIDQESSRLFGPRQGGVWPANSISLVGPTGAQGSTILTGSGAPAANVGNPGDCYYDPAGGRFWGTKTEAGWPATSVNLKGVPGDRGTSILTGDGPPDAAVGSIGDAYVDVTNGLLFSAKTESGWPQSPKSLLGTAAMDVLTSQAAGLGPGFTVAGTLSPTVPLPGLYPGSTQQVPFSPIMANALMGISYSNVGAALTLSLLDKDTAAVVYSQAIPAASTGNFGLFGLATYPLVQNKAYIWQATGASGTANLIVNPIYLYPSASPAYSVTSLTTAARSTPTTFSATNAVLYMGGSSSQSYTWKLPKPAHLYAVTITNTSTGTLTVRMYQNSNSAVLVQYSVPPGTTQNYGPYALGTYKMASVQGVGAVGQYYWAAAGTGTGTIFVDAQVVMDLS